MPVLTSQNWDGGSAPFYWPADWSTNAFLSTFVPTTPLGDISSPNVVACTFGTGLEYFTTWQTADGNGGNVQVAAYFGVSAPTSSTATFGYSIFARGSSNSCGTSTTQYELNYTITSQTGVLTLFSDSGGTQTTLASVLPCNVPYRQWWQLTLTCFGTSIVGALQLANGNWAQPSGNFQIGQINAISVTDFSISGSGYAGMAMSTSNSFDPPCADDISIATYPPQSGLLLPQIKPASTRISGPLFTSVYG